MPQRFERAGKPFSYHQWIKQEALPQLERVGDNRLLSGELIHLLFSDALDKDNPRYLRRLVAAAQATHSPRLLSHAYQAQGTYYHTTGDYY